MRHYSPCLLFLLCALASCGGSSALQQPDPVGIPTAELGQPAAAGRDGIPFPQDGVQPWEQVDARGFVIPQSSRGLSALTADSEFVPGIERFLEGGGFSNAGEATRLASPAGGAVAYAMYRLTLAGRQPGVITVDANLRTAASEYYVAVADYGKQRWQWSGPFAEAQLTLDINGGDAISLSGNAFVLVAAHDGSEIDIVGVGATPLDAGDTAAPPAPAAPSVTAVRGGLELTWVPVIAADLAGYRVHYSDVPFSGAAAPGVQTLPFLENTTRLVLARPAKQTYVALSAVDISGNASALSPRANALPKGGALSGVALTTSSVSGTTSGWRLTKSPRSCSHRRCGSWAACLSSLTRGPVWRNASPAATTPTVTVGRIS